MHLLTGIWSADETDTTETIPTTLMPLLQEIAAPVHFPTLRKLCSVVVVGFSAFTSHGFILQGRCQPALISPESNDGRCTARLHYLHCLRSSSSLHSHSQSHVLICAYVKTKK